MPELRTPRILWGALLFSTVLYLVVLFMVHPPHQELQPLYPPLFGLLSLGIAVVSFVLPAQGYKQTVLRQKPEIAEEADQQGSDIIPYRDAPKRRVFASPTDARRMARIAYQTPFILGMALSEAIALFGFVLGFLGHPLPYFIPFFVFAWVLMLVRFPTEKAVYGRYEQAMGASFPR